MDIKTQFDREFFDSHKELPQREIAKITNLSQDTVRRRMIAYKIPFREKLVNLAGEKCGKWEVLYRDEERQKGTFWVCRCACGLEKSVNAYCLKKGGSCKSCAYWEGVGEISKDCFSGIVRSAKKRSLDFDLTMEFLWDLFLKQERLCALTKVPLIFCRNRRKFPPPTASLDRIDSNLGYVKENVQWIHKTIQQMKWDYPQNEYINWCKLVSNNAT
jgi:hypothetical protein